MKNQTIYDKVNSNMVAPLSIIFSIKFDDFMLDAYMEDLAEYSAKTLMDSFKQIRRTCKKMPLLAGVIEICEEVKKKSFMSSGDVYVKKQPCFYMGKIENGNPEIAKELLSNKAGILALELGVANSIFNAYELSGRKEFSEDWVRHQRKCLEDGIREMEQNKKQNPSLYKVLASLAEGMNIREKNILEKFGNLKNAITYSPGELF